MSDQAKDHGHHAITREAVRQFFQSGRADAQGRIDGMSELEYFHALDRAQENQDLGVGPAPSYGTSVPAAWDGDAQRQHGMADPRHDGAWNVDTDRRYVENELAIAHEGGTRDTEVGHLGAAAHALQDSYSEAHMFRGNAANTGDPNAPIQSINVWDPLPHRVDGHWHGKGLSDEQGTHDERLDEVPVSGNPNLDQNVGADAVPLEHGSDRAAAAATAEMLETYHDYRSASMSEAVAADRRTVGHFYQQDPHGVQVNRDENDPAWQAERNRRLREHQAEDAQWNAGQTSVDPNASPDPQPPGPNASYDPSASGQ